MDELEKARAIIRQRLRDSERAQRAAAEAAERQLQSFAESHLRYWIRNVSGMVAGGYDNVTVHYGRIVSTFSSRDGWSLVQPEGKRPPVNFDDFLTAAVMRQLSAAGRNGERRYSDLVSEMLGPPFRMTYQTSRVSLWIDYDQAR